MQAWIAGATGLVGRALVELLVRDVRVEKVTALVRRRALPSHSKLEELLVDFERLEPALAGRTVSHAFSCLGTTMAQAKSEQAFRQVDLDYPLAFGRVARQAGAESLLCVSAMGANPESLVFYNRVKGELEVALAQIGFSRLHLLRPSLLDGERDASRTGERLALTLARPLGRLLVGPLEKYRPIAASDVAKAMVRLAFDARPGQVVHESDQIARLAKTESGSGSEPGRPRSGFLS